MNTMSHHQFAIFWLFINLSFSAGFIPNKTRKWSTITSTSHTHKEIMENAVHKMATVFMDDHPERYFVRCIVSKTQWVQEFSDL